MVITMQSQLSGKFYSMDLPILLSKYEDWCQMVDEGSAPHIQSFFSELNADQREFLMTGITKEEWDEVFGDDEE